MAWWTHLLFFGDYFPEDQNVSSKEETGFAAFRHAFKNYIYDNFLDILRFFLGVFTYLYLGLTIVTFFLGPTAPKSFPYIVDALSEPYLGALGIYVVIKEIERRRGKKIEKPMLELFAIIWLLFLITATALTFFSEKYPPNIVYKVVVTNALAALIIRIGTLLR